MKSFKSTIFFQKTGVYGAMACLPVTVFLGPAIAFPASCLFLGLTVSAIAVEIEQKKEKPVIQPVPTSVKAILAEFKRLNNGGQANEVVSHYEEVESQIAQSFEIKDEIDRLNPLQVGKKMKKERELEESRDTAMDEWLELMGNLVEDTKIEGEAE